VFCATRNYAGTRLYSGWSSHYDIHQYIKKIAHLHSWEFFLLADNIQSVKVGLTPKHDHYQPIVLSMEVVE
jgi:hypothetical protein